MKRIGTIIHHTESVQLELIALYELRTTNRLFRFTVECLPSERGKHIGKMYEGKCACRLINSHIQTHLYQGNRYCHWNKTMENECYTCLGRERDRERVSIVSLWCVEHLFRWKKIVHIPVGCLNSLIAIRSIWIEFLF